MFLLVIGITMIAFILFLIILSIFKITEKGIPDSVVISHFEIKNESVFFKVDELNQNIYEIEKPKNFKSVDKLAISFDADHSKIVAIKKIIVNDEVVFENDKKMTTVTKLATF